MGDGILADGDVDQLGAVIVYFMISRMWQRNDWIVILTLPVSTIVFFLGYMNNSGCAL